MSAKREPNMFLLFFGENTHFNEASSMERSHFLAHGRQVLKGHDWQSTLFSLYTYMVLTHAGHSNVWDPLVRGIVCSVLSMLGVGENKALCIGDGVYIYFFKCAKFHRMGKEEKGLIVRVIVIRHKLLL